MSKSNSSVIFVLGQAQNIILSSLLSTLGKDDVWVFTVYPVVCPKTVRVVNIKPRNLVQFVVMFFSVWRAQRAFRASEAVSLYTPHLLNFIANKIYYKFSKKIKLNYLFDGILNYRSVSADQPWAVSYQKKQAFKSLAVFHKYKHSSQQVVDESLPDVAGLYVPSGVVINSLKFSKPVIVVPTDVTNFVPEPRVLVLEPPLDTVAVKTFQGKLISLMRSDFIGYEVYIKYHPSMTETKLDISEFKSLGFVVRMVTEASPAEVIYKDQRCSAVISSNSSALLMIKVNYPNSKVFSIDCRLSDADPSMRDVENIMKEAGVVIV